MTSVPGSTRRSTRARPTDDTLLDAAIGVIARRGLTAATMADIARAADTSKPTLYAHFADKDALYRAAIDREVEVCRDRLFTAYELSSSLPAKQQIEADVAAFFDYVRDRPDGFALLFLGERTATLGPTATALRADIAAQVEARVTAWSDHAGIDARPVAAQLATMIVAVSTSAAEEAVRSGSDTAAAGRLAAAFCVSALLGLAADS